MILQYAYIIRTHLHKTHYHSAILLKLKLHRSSLLSSVMGIMVKDWCYIAKHTTGVKVLEAATRSVL